MVGILENKSLQSPPSLSNAFSMMRPKNIDMRSITISFEWRIIFHVKILL
jgi:plasmid maintenance system killer protein